LIGNGFAKKHFGSHKKIIRF